MSLVMEKSAAAEYEHPYLSLVNRQVAPCL